MKHSRSLESCPKIDEVNEEDKVAESKTDLEEIKEEKDIGESIISRIPQTVEDIPKRYFVKESPAKILTKNLNKNSSGDLTPEVTTTQDFMAKINKIYSEKSRLNTTNLYFVVLIISLLNILLIILSIGNKNELTEKLISLKIKANLSLSCIIFVIYKFFPPKKHYNLFLSILTVYINILIFMTNSLFLHVLFYYDKDWSEASHSMLFERDLRILTVTTMLIYYRFEIKNMLLLCHFVIIFFFAVFFSIFYFKLGLWQNYEDFIVSYFYFALEVLFILISRWKNYFVKHEKNVKREAIETEAAKIKEELESVKKKLENTFKTISSPETASKADELLMKLKFLKFQALVNLKNKITSPSANSGKRKYKRNSNMVLTDTGGSYSPSKINRNIAGGDNNQQSKILF